MSTAHSIKCEIGNANQHCMNLNKFTKLLETRDGNLTVLLLINHLEES